MANSISYKDKQFRIGDTLKLMYKLREGERERIQPFSGILIKTRGQTPETRQITLRKVSKSGVGVERIIPLASPYIADIQLERKGTYKKSKLYFIRGLSDQRLRQKIYKSK